jgi:hypothetical protein
MLTFTSAKPGHLTNPFQRLGQIGPQGIILARSPGALHRRCPRARLALVARALAVGNAIEHVEPRRDRQTGNRGTDGANDVPRQPGAILQAAAVPAGSPLGRQQLAKQVAMALLDVDEVVSDLVGQLRGCDIVIHQPSEVFIGDKRIT